MNCEHLVPTEIRTFRIYKNTLFNSGQILVVEGEDLTDNLPCSIHLTFSKNGGSSVELFRFEGAKGCLEAAVSGTLDEDTHREITRSILRREELQLEVRDMEKVKKYQRHQSGIPEVAGKAYAPGESTG